MSKAFSGSSKLVFICLFLIFLNSVVQMISVLGTLFLHNLGYTALNIGFIFTFFGIGSLIGGYLGGVLSDRFPITKIIKISLVGNAIFIGIFPFYNMFAYFLICMLIIGFFCGIFRPLAILLLFECNKGLISESRLIAYRRVSINLGFSIGAATLGFLYEYNSRLAFLTISIILIFGFFLSRFIVVDTKKKHKEDVASINKSASNNYIFYILNIILVISLIILNQNKTTYNIFLESFASISVKDISLLFALNGLIIIFLQIPLSHIFNKLSYAVACFYGMLFLALGIGMTGVIGSFSLAIISCVLWTIGEMVLYPPLLIYIINSSNYSKGRTMGIYQVFYSVGSLVAPLLGTLIYDYSPQLLWSTFLILGVVCSIVFLLIYKWWRY
ncbi:MFS transporter [Francisella sp. 19X1-34]|uniref:MFS transporter n=1 Tax=Francisella sp. 19X1-34 TaxID=3087177 RepID=UPI002E33E07E|nr:MFS transporter [Francisella sp. 19X1-34]MED7789199.1 MFS transporter [Francisella sp. 19X1-34]